MNNFDKSSSGVNLECNCFSNQHASEEAYKSSLFTVQSENNRLPTIIAFKYSEDLDVSKLEKSFNINCSSKELFKYYFNYYFSIDKDFSLFSELSKLKLLLCELKDHLGTKESLKNISIDDFKSAIFLDLFENKKDFELFLSKHFEPTFVSIISQGYSQGDYVEVLFFKEVLDLIKTENPELSKLTDQEIANSFQEHIDNLCWDQIVYCDLYIDGELYQLDEFLSNMYKYDKKEIINGLQSSLEHQNLDYIIGWLDDNLPDFIS